MSTADTTKTASVPTSFEEFWPEYVRAHASPLNRRIHFVGTTLAMACVGGALLMRRPSLLLAAPVAGYGFAWFGHFFIEKNRPATFEHPLWSLRGDFVMWKKMLEGSMDAEVARVLAAGEGVENVEKKRTDDARAHAAPADATLN